MFRQDFSIFELSNWAGKRDNSCIWQVSFLGDTCNPRYDGLQEMFVSKWKVQVNGGSAKTSDFLPYDLELHEQRSPQVELIRLSGKEWPSHFLHLCAGDYEEAWYVHAKSGFVYSE